MTYSKLKRTTILFVLAICTIGFVIPSAPIANASIVTMKQTKVVLDEVNILAGYTGSCGNWKLSFGVEWQRIYNSYWNVFSSDSSYTNTGYQTIFIGEFSETTTGDFFYSSTYSSNIYASSYVNMYVRVEVKTWSGGVCGYHGSYYTNYWNPSYLSSGNNPTSSHLTPYSGNAWFYFTIVVS